VAQGEIAVVDFEGKGGEGGGEDAAAAFAPLEVDVPAAVPLIA
jgi:hypothetical protein